MSAPVTQLTGYSVIFDLDGTLVDTAPDLISTLNLILQSHNLQPVKEQLIRPIISLGARNMIQVGFDMNNQTINEATLDQLLYEFLSYYQAHIADKSQPFDGMECALQSLLEKGAILGVCTNKTQAMAELLLQKLNLSEYFIAIAGRDRFKHFKPHPDHLFKTVDLMGGQQDRVILVGDSGTDIETAKRADIPVIACSFGYEDKKLEDLNPDVILNHYDALIDIILQFTSNTPDTPDNSVT